MNTIKKSCPKHLICIKIITVMLFAYSFQPLLFAQPEPPASVEEINHIGGHLFTSAVRGQYAFLSQGPNLAVLFIQGQSITKVASLPTFLEGEPYHVSGNYLYLSYSTEENKGVLEIIDISNPTSPARIIRTRLNGIDGYINKIQVQGDFAFLMAGSWTNNMNKVHIVDISNPASPALVSTYENDMTDFIPSGDEAYFIQGSSAQSAGNRFGVLNISDRANPQVTSLTDLPHANNLYTTNGTVYVGMSNSQGLRILEVSDPQNSNVIGQYGEGTGSYNKIIVPNSHAYIRAGRKLIILDVTTPDDPRLTSEYEFDTIFNLDHVEGNSVYIRHDGQFKIMDVSDPALPTMGPVFDEPENIRGMAVLGNHLFLATADDKIRSYDFTNPENPILRHAFDFPDANKVFGTGTLLFAADWSTTGNITLYDISDVDNPRQLSTYMANAPVLEVGFRNDHAYVLTSPFNGPSDLQILDITDPASPTPTGTLQLAGLGQDMFVSQSGAQVYVAYYQDEATKGFQVIDVSAPDNPQSVHQTGVENRPRSILAANGTLFLGKNTGEDDGPSFIDVYDVGDPTNPQFRHTHTVSQTSSIYDMQYREDIFMITLPQQGLATYAYDFENSVFIDGPGLEMPMPRNIAVYKPVISAKRYNSPRQLSIFSDLFAFVIKGGAYQFEVNGKVGLNEIRIVPPWLVPQPVLTVGLEAEPDSSLCPPDPGEALIVARGTVKAENANWTVNRMTFTHSGHAKRDVVIQVLMRIQGIDVPGQMTVDADNHILTVGFSPGITVQEGTEVPFTIDFIFTFPSGSPGTYLPLPIDEIRIDQLSIKADQVSAEPDRNQPGLVEPQAPVYSGTVTIACVWSIREKPEKPFLTIQDAVDDAKDAGGGTIWNPDRIQLCPGIYTENVTVNQNDVIINGMEGAERTIVQSAATLSKSVVPASAEAGSHQQGKNTPKYVFHLTGTQITISGLTVTGADQPDGAGIYATGNCGFCTFERNIIRNNENGILLAGSGVRYTRVFDSQILDNKKGVALTSNSDETTIGREAYPNIISGNQYGIYIDNSGNNNIYFNKIGTDPSGKEARPNGSGIYAKSSRWGYISGNLISGNTEHGVVLDQSGDFIISYNKIGTDVEGKTILKNGKNGIWLQNAYSNDIIKAWNIENSGNIISGNGQHGIHLTGPGTEKNIIYRNMIGVGGPIDTSPILPNEGNGIMIDGGAHDNLIGSDDYMAGNVIGGNKKNGIEISGEGADSTRILNNFIGCKALTAHEAPNELNGIYIHGNARYNRVVKNVINYNSHGVFITGGASYNMIGDSTKSTINRISGNRDNGVMITGKGTTKNVVFYNRIGNFEENVKNQKNGVFITDQASQNTITENDIAYNISTGIFILSEGIQEAAWTEAELLDTGTDIQGFRTDSDDPLSGVQILDNRIYKNYSGILLSGKGVQKCIIHHNRIYENTLSGLSLAAGANHNQVGDAAGEQPNYIFDTTGSGIEILGEGTESNEIRNNFIGSDEEGLNHANQYGIHIYENAHSNTIRGNVISHSREHGIYIEYSHQTRIDRNYIGSTRDETTIAWNEGAGIHLKASDGTMIMENNYIRFNRQGGIQLLRSYQNTIHGNFIEYNFTNGIALDGAHENDFYNNHISNNTEAGLHFKKSHRNVVHGNGIVDNKVKGVKLVDSRGNGWEDKSIFEANTFRGNKKNTAIYMDNAYALIRGNVVTEDETDGIKCVNGSFAVVTQNNIYDNGGFGLNNVDASVTIPANDNWWGDAGGPGTEDISGSIDASTWLTQAVSLVAGFSRDTVYIAPGVSDSVIIFFRNFETPHDGVDVTLQDDYGWIADTTIFSMIFTDSTGAAEAITISVPAGTPEGFADRVRLTAVSQTNPGTAVSDSLLILAYLPRLIQITVQPDSVTMHPGDTLQFTAMGRDQFDHPISFIPLWTATGGTVDPAGLYIAGNQQGSFTVTARDTTGLIQGQAAVQITSGTDVETEDIHLPTEFALEQNYPNPFNSETAIRFSVKEACRVVLKVFDLRGREMAELVDADRQAGEYTVRFDANGLPSGIYVYRIWMKNPSTGSGQRFVAVRKMVVLE